MSMKFTQLQCKEVICVSDGRRLGFVSDVLVEVPRGRSPPLWFPAPAAFWVLPGGMMILSFPGNASAALARTLFWWTPSLTSAGSPGENRACPFKAGAPGNRGVLPKWKY